MADLVTDAWLSSIYRDATDAHLIAYAESLVGDYVQAYRDGPARAEYVERRLGLVCAELARRGVPFNGRLFPL